MKNKKLIDAVQTALKKLARDGIEGWGLNSLYLVDDEGKRTSFGELIEIGPEYGCTSETCSHSSHDPAAPIIKWIPPKGCTLSRLGEDGERTFYHLTNDNEEYILIRIDGGHYHDRLQWAEIEEVPAFILARLAGR